MVPRRSAIESAERIRMPLGVEDPSIRFHAATLAALDW